VGERWLSHISQRVYRLHGGRVYQKQQPRRRLSRARILAAGVSLIIVTSITATAMAMSRTTDAARPVGKTSVRTISDVSKTTKNSSKPKNTSASTTPKTSSATPPVTSMAIPATVGAINPPSWMKLPLYTDPYNDAATYYQNNPSAAGATLIKRQGEAPVATWFGEWDADVKSATNSYVTSATQKSAVPVLVLYAIPQRDCGGYSSGGVSDTASYLNWMRNAAAGIGNRTAVVILEPDELAGLDCLSAADQQNRYSALSQAVSILKTTTSATVYIDAGNPAWQTSATMAARLKQANIAQADGFSLNVSNYVPTSQNQTYGNQLSKLLNNRHYVIDTSRNGFGGISPDGWCNAPSAALGSLPTVNTGEPLNDALLWIKIPWESDGTCNGGPSAGTSFWSFAVRMAQNAGW